MPMYDRTGPTGEGPRTGWGRGYCVGGLGMGQDIDLTLVDGQSIDLGWMYVQAKPRANIRSEPTTQSAIVGKVEYGGQVKIIAQTEQGESVGPVGGKWYGIEALKQPDGSGQSIGGWIYGSLVSKTKPKPGAGTSGGGGGSSSGTYSGGGDADVTEPSTGKWKLWAAGILGVAAVGVGLYAFFGGDDEE